MEMTKPNVSEKKPINPNGLEVEQRPGETAEQATARALLEPYARHGIVSSIFVSQMTGESAGMPTLMDYIRQYRNVGAEAKSGDMALASRILAAQAMTLDGMFTNLSRRAALNLSAYPDAAEKFARLALKAQSNCRATLEALVKLHQPREQTVRHVHVNEGGQAIVADQFHHHQREAENTNANGQSHATGSNGEGHSLPSKDTQGNSVPIPGSAGQAALQNARRD